MERFNWTTFAFNFSDQHSGRYRVQIEEAEDGVSAAIMLLKEARSGIKGPDLAILEDSITGLSTTVDKIRKLRKDLKNL